MRPDFLWDEPSSQVKVQRNGLRFRFFLFAGVIFGVHRFSKAPDSFSQSFAEFRQLLGPKDKQSDEGDYEQVHRLEQIVKQGDDSSYP
jgi:hypothetical protein